MDKFVVLKRKSNLPASTPTSSKITRTDVSSSSVTEPPAAPVHGGTSDGKHGNVDEYRIGF